MRRILHTGAGPYGTIADQRYDRDPVVPDDIKIDGTKIAQIRAVSEELEVDGERILELLGVPSEEGAPPENWDTLAGADRKELLALIEQLMTEIEDHFRPEENISDMDFDPDRTERISTEPTDGVYLNVYRNAYPMQLLLEFAIEEDLELYTN